MLRTVWTGGLIAEGQFRRGYFERFGGEVGLAVDNAVRPSMLPSFLRTDDGTLGVPPGMIAVVPLVPGAGYDLSRDSTLPPYIVVGTEAAVTPAASDLQLLPGEARVVSGRTLSLHEGRLAFIAWDPTRPWREDAARLLALRAGCAALDGTLPLTVRAAEDRLEVGLGRCSLAEPLPSPADPTPLLAALAGPEWLTVARGPGWIAERRVVWPVLAVVVAKVAATWWGLGLTSAVAVSGAIAGAAFYMPVPAVLTWPLTLIIGVVAAILRIAGIVLRQLPPRRRVPAVLAALALAGCAVAIKATRPDSFPPVTRADATCAVVGYSTVKGEGLRRERGGIRSILDEGCMRCRDKTGGIFAGGEVLAWARDAFCASTPSFGADGQVTFLGGANDDLLWGVLAIGRLFIIGQQGIEAWRHNLIPAATASLARIDEQVSALDGLMQCARSRGARFLFLHDFLITDLVAGRGAERDAMLARRRAAVEAAGGTFVDLFHVFAAEAGISWFNDYVHLSRIAHERVADLACRQTP